MKPLKSQFQNLLRFPRDLSGFVDSDADYPDDLVAGEDYGDGVAEVAGDFGVSEEVLEFL